MMTSKSGCKIDSVEVGEVKIDFFDKTTHGMDSGIMSVKYAFVNAKEGARMGFGNKNTWSPEVLAKLAELVAAMENDICLTVFGEGHTPGSAVPSVEDTSDGVPEL